MPNGFIMIGGSVELVRVSKVDVNCTTGYGVEVHVVKSIQSVVGGGEGDESKAFVSGACGWE